ncbi:hypothetical protein [Streptantibioticus ferralitis]|uniref:Uncharacterized protein n=1 Tax=Streptantibioticus ferralitis TaxID=236510 RepID=A0ABT5Z7I4_9ACTN|nr:hypothetical protein [Streptantibioticus ferralitis]MDF2259773.1 hypothetical protein [Streptantibioticus ferralitis]
MELTDENREAVRAAAAAMVERAAAGDQRAVNSIGSVVEAQFGAGGLAYLMLQFAEDVVQYAPDEVRNPFAKVQPGLALTAEQFEALADLVHPDWLSHAAGCGKSPAPMAVIFDHVAAYLRAVQRQDTSGMVQVVRTVAEGHPTDRAMMFETVLALASMYSPAASR